MRYFELFGIPVQLRVDTASLRKKFYALSRAHHPDYVASGTPGDQSEALENSAQLNKAWKTFQDTDQTIAYVLREKGLMEVEEKYELPAEFLMEVLGINEQLMDADEPAMHAALRDQLSKLEAEIYAAVKNTVENYQENVTSKEELLQVKDYYYKKKYLDRIRQQLAGMA